MADLCFTDKEIFTCESRNKILERRSRRLAHARCAGAWAFKDHMAGGNATLQVQRIGERLSGEFSSSQGAGPVGLALDGSTLVVSTPPGFRADFRFTLDAATATLSGANLLGATATLKCETKNAASGKPETRV